MRYEVTNPIKDTTVKFNNRFEAISYIDNYHLNENEVLWFIERDNNNCIKHMIEYFNG